jgi:two-component system LytT family response regulator
MIKVLIIDDEAKARNVLFHYIHHYIPEVIEVKQAASVEEAQAILRTYRPGIVFLDIEMPGQNGFDFLKTIDDPAFDVIFTTSHNHYAIQAIRFSALDYLMKPVDPGELILSIRRHLNKQDFIRQKRLLFHNLLSNLGKEHANEFRLSISCAEGIFFFGVSEILRLEANRNYTAIHLVGRKPFRFLRTHKSHLVNADHIIRISNNNEYVILTDGSRIEISRRKKEEVQRFMNIR